METNTPAHDFAPAWLKLPAPVKKLSTANVGETPLIGDQQSHWQVSNSNCRKDNFNKTNNPDFGQQPARFNSNNHKPSHYLNSRNNSFGDDEKLFQNSCPSTCNNLNGKYLKSTNETTHRIKNDLKDNGYHSKSSSRIAETNAGLSYIKKTKDGEKVRAKKGEENCNNFNQEFPSLVDDKNGTNDNKYLQSSAWNNNATKNKVLSTLKNVQLIQRSVADFDSHDSPKNDSNSLSAIASKAANSQVYRNMSLIGKTRNGNIKENANLINGLGNNIGHCKILPVLGKTSILSANSTQTMEVLVKNPKMRDNKSNFFKSFRDDAKDRNILFDPSNKQIDKMQNTVELENKNKRDQVDDNASSFKSQTDPIPVHEGDDSSKHFMKLNGHDDEDDVDIDAILSSSLEAEHRLLLELGWKQEDEVPPITEEEVKEFKDLMSARNGFKPNTANIQQQHIQVNLSPKKVSIRSPFVSAADTLNNQMSDNDDDDDSTSSSDDDE